MCAGCALSRLVMFRTKHDILTVFGHTTTSLSPAACAMKVQEGCTRENRIFDRRVGAGE
ncbi:unnamed protein product [Ectocarpus sp. 8 AP-2014]